MAISSIIPPCGNPAKDFASPGPLCCFDVYPSACLIDDGAGGVYVNPLGVPYECPPPSICVLVDALGNVLVDALGRAVRCP